MTALLDQPNFADLAITELPTLELHGTARQMGEQLGEATRAETHELFERRLAAAIRFAHGRFGKEISLEQILAVAHQGLPATRDYDPIGYEEFIGIARGADLSPEQLYVMQGLTDLRDVLAFSGPQDAEGCTAFMVDGSRTNEGDLLVGQTWDLVSDNMPFVCLIHRRPTDGSPHTWSLSVAGCLTLIGLNSEGIAVGNTNLHTRDVRPGLQYLSVLHRAVRSRTFEEAVEAVRDSTRSAAHYYYVADDRGNAAGLECSASQSVALGLRDGLLVHANHCQSPEIAALEVAPPDENTLGREKRLTQLFNSQSSVSLDDIKQMLADHEGGKDAICRHSKTDTATATNACVIMNPATRELHACRGQAHVGEWRTVSAA